MITKHVLFLTVLLAVQSSRADWVIVQKTHSGDRDSQMTIKIKDNKIRNDMGERMTVMLDANSGMAQMFMHEKKTVMRMDTATIKGMGGLAGALIGGGEVAKPRATGEKVKVGAWDTEVYTWEGKLGSAKFYIAKDFPKFDDLNKAMDKLTKAMGNPMAGLYPNNADFPGMVVKSEMTMMGKLSSSELVSATEQPVSDEDFKAPEGYKEMKMPSLPPGLMPKQR